MNTDIRLATTFVGHRKRRRLKRLLGPGYLDYLIDLWLRIALCRPDGDLSGWTVEDIADEARFEGDPQKFVDALVTSGWFDYDKRKKCYRPHDWEIYQTWAIEAEKRSKHAAKAAAARWEKRYRKKADSSQASGNNNKTSNARSMPGAMPGACPEQCGEDADRNAPILSYPILSNNDFTNVKSGRKPSKHFNQAAGQFLNSIKDKCEKIKTLPQNNGDRFNGYQFVQFMTNRRIHPGAINDTLGRMIKRWPNIESKWPYGERIIKRLNGNYNENESIIQSEQFKTILADLAKMLGQPAGDKKTH
jgi:hypothetical protein